MADKREPPSKSKKPAPPDSAPTTVDLAKEFARAVIREHGVPEDVLADLKDQLKAAGVDPAVVEKLGRSYSDPHTHYQKPPKPPKPPKLPKPEKKAKKK
jgi:hypothetical protein